MDDNDNQLIFITKKEYNSLLLYKKYWHSLIERLDEVSKELYNVPYYIGPSALAVAYEQIQDMYDEISYRRVPWYKVRRNK